MKKKYAALLFCMVLLLTGCGGSTEPADANLVQSTPESVIAEPTPESTEPAAASDTAANTSVSAAKTAVPAKPTATPEPTATPTATPEPTAEPTPEPVAEPATAPAVNLSYGAIPFDLAAQSGTWWQIDGSDSAYWAVQENINAIRAVGGLGSLSMSDGLSASAGTRCQNFVEGGAFDHSGMITKSEICASGPVGSASEVCSAWQNSPDHYANIMRTDISSMGVACWFCSTENGNYTYWVVTFE